MCWYCNSIANYLLRRFTGFFCRAAHGGLPWDEAVENVCIDMRRCANHPVRLNPTRQVRSDLNGTVPLERQRHDGPAKADYRLLRMAVVGLGLSGRGVRFVQQAGRVIRGSEINHIPMRMQDVYVAAGILAGKSLVAALRVHRITELKRWRTRAGHTREHRATVLPARRGFGLLRGDRREWWGLPTTRFRQRGDAGDLGRGPERGGPRCLIAIADRCGLEGRELLDAADTEVVCSEYRGYTGCALAGGDRVTVLRFAGGSFSGPGPPRHA